MLLLEAFFGLHSSREGVIMKNDGTSTLIHFLPLTLHRLQNELLLKQTFSGKPFHFSSRDSLTPVGVGVQK